CRLLPFTLSSLQEVKLDWGQSVQERRELANPLTFGSGTAGSTKGGNRAEKCSGAIYCS
ncbi:hypothetical protein BaRGS_00028068, partial [Batillaria attramentaria]